MTSTEARTSSENVTSRFWIFQLFKVIMLEKCVLTIPELNRNQRLGHKKTKLNISHHMLASSIQLLNRSFLVEEKNENVFKMSKDEKCTCVYSVQKYCLSLLNMQICGFFCCRRRRGCLIRKLKI